MGVCQNPYLAPVKILIFLSKNLALFKATFGLTNKQTPLASRGKRSYFAIQIMGHSQSQSQSNTIPASPHGGGTPGETITFGQALELGLITVDRLSAKPCWFCNQLRITTDSRSRVDSLLMDLPLYCCSTCQNGFELILPDEPPTALLRTLSARATVKKVIPYDVFSHFTVTSTNDLQTNGDPNPHRGISYLDASASLYFIPSSDTPLTHLPTICLNTHPCTGEELEKCYICSENLSSQRYCLTMPCKSQHRFHKACLRPWLEGDTPSQHSTLLIIHSPSRYYSYRAVRHCSPSQYCS